MRSIGGNIHPNRQVTSCILGRTRQKLKFKRWRIKSIQGKRRKTDFYKLVQDKEEGSRFSESLQQNRCLKNIATP